MMAHCNMAATGKMTKAKKKASRMIARKLGSLAKDLNNLEISEQPTVHIFVGNGGLMCEVNRSSLLNLFGRFGKVDRIDMFPKKSYAFVTFCGVQDATNAYSSIHGRKLIYPEEFPRPDYTLYLAFLRAIQFPSENIRPCDSVALVKKDGDYFIATESSLIRGLELKSNFVSKEYEAELLGFFTSKQMPMLPKSDLSVLGDNSKGIQSIGLHTPCSTGETEQKTFISGPPGCELKHRNVCHYGYEFKYDSNNIDRKNPLDQKIPSLCKPLIKQMLELDIMKVEPDQLTINDYQPGQGIPPHVDTHSAFEDGLVSLSLGSQVVMDFRHPNGVHKQIFLPARSLLVMTGESRYLWSHGITPRRYDIISESTDTTGNTLLERGRRVSLTFRKVRQSPCNCQFSSECDSQGFASQTNIASSQSSKDESNQLQIPSTESEAQHLESQHVHDVYDTIAGHFSDTRHSAWPKIATFLKGLPLSSLVADVGCGNGKYLGVNTELAMFGSDRSVNLGLICRERGHSVVVADILSLPYRAASFDACICIAVIHHLSTEKRRKNAVQELIRILKPGGKLLISVWALEQETASHSLIQEIKSKERNEGQISTDVDNSSEIRDFNILVTTQRNVFKQQDVFVPWHYNKGKSKRRIGNDGTQDTGTSNVDPVFHRYYHVFRKGELGALCLKFSNIQILESYYDKGNWCVVAEKSL